jgi:hypothetical protein
MSGFKKQASMAKFFFKMVIFLLVLLAIDLAGSLILKHGLDRYYGLNEEAEILCVGHSRVVWGIDEELLEKRLHRSMAKYAVQGTSLDDHYVMIQQYMEAHPGSAKIMLYIVDDYVFGKGLGTNQYRLFYPFMDAACIAAHIQMHAATRSEYAARKCLRLLRFSDTTIQSTARMGLTGGKELSPDDTLNILELEKKLAKLKLDEQYCISADNVERFDKILRLARSHGLTLVLLYVPFIDLLDESGKAGHGEALLRFRNYAQADPGIILIEIDHAYAHNHNLFTDATHPNRAGQIYITEQLAEALQCRFDKSRPQ